MQLLSIIIGILIVYFVLEIIYSKLWSKNLQAYVEFKEKIVEEGENVTVEECIENRKWLPLPMITMKYELDKCFYEKDKVIEKLSDKYNRNEIFSILMFQRIRRRVEFICSKRGIYNIKKFNIIVSNLFLNENHFCELESKGKLTVYPKYVDIKRFMEIYQNIYGNIITNTFMKEDPFTYRGVRDYQIYDTMKTINWGASAKTGNLKVNVLENTSDREVSIFLNIVKDNMLYNSEVIEECIRLAKTFAANLYKNGFKCNIYTNGKEIENDSENYITVEKYDSTKSYMDIVNDALAHIVVKDGRYENSEKLEDNFVELYKEKIEKINSNKFLLFISNYQREDFQNMLIDLKKKNRTFSWIVPVSNRNDYHVDDFIKKEAKVWRLNWEGANRE